MFQQNCLLTMVGTFTILKPSKRLDHNSVSGLRARRLRPARLVFSV